MKARARSRENDGCGETRVLVNDSIKPAKQISELFRAVTAKLTPILRYGFSQLALYDSSTGQLTTRGSYFPNGKGLIHEGLRFPIANTPAGRVFTSGKPMRMDRTQRLHRSDLIDRLLAEGVRSGCCVALRSGNSVIGTFSIGSSRTHAFSSETERLLMAVSTDLGVLIERSLPYSDARQLKNDTAQIPFSSATNELLTSTLVSYIRNGDMGLFRELIRPYEKVIYSIAYSILQHHAEAEEVAQETLLKALTHLHQLHSPAKFRQWLLQIALNEARIRRRQNKHYIYEPLDTSEERFSFFSAPTRDPVEHGEFQSALNRALNSLPPAYREIVTLRDVQDRTVIETATALGISVASVKTRLHRARRALRARLSAEFNRAA